MSVGVVAAGRERNWVVGLVSAGHFYSHFVMLCLPPMFLAMKHDLDASYAAVGSIMTALNAMSGIGQIPMGFLVDRFGGRRVLVAGIALMGACLALVGLSTAYWQLVALFATAGIGNSVFHPADYAILNARVERGYFGRAASVHTFAGYLGWTAAPPVMVALSALAGWRTAVAAVGLAGVALALAMLLRGRLLDDQLAASHADGPPTRHASFADGLRLMRSLPMAMMFAFFALIGAATMGLMAFSVVALVGLDRLDILFANTVLTAHLFASACGVLVGGWLADRTARHNLVAALAIFAMAAAVAALGTEGLPGALVFLLMASAGLVYGISSPSRDVIVRAVTPPESTGVAFGFTATGLSLGTAIGPVLFGSVMDMHRPGLLFGLVAAVIALSVATVMLTRYDGAQTPHAFR
jgi:MFS family permease